MSICPDKCPKCGKPGPFRGYSEVRVRHYGGAWHIARNADIDYVPWVHCEQCGHEIELDPDAAAWNGGEGGER